MTESEKKTILEQIRKGEIDVEPYDPNTLNMPTPIERQALQSNIEENGLIEPLTVTFKEGTPYIVNGNARYEVYKNKVESNQWKHSLPEIIEIPIEKAQKCRAAEFYHKDKTALQRAIYGAYYFGEKLQANAEERQKSGKKGATCETGTVGHHIGKIVGCGASYGNKAKQLINVDKEFFYDMIFKRAIPMPGKDIRAFIKLPDDRKKEYIESMKKHIDDPMQNENDTLFRKAEKELGDYYEKKDNDILSNVAGGSAFVEELTTALLDKTQDNTNVINDQDINLEYTESILTNKEIPFEAKQLINELLREQFGIESKFPSMEFVKFDPAPYQLLMEMQEITLPSYWLSKEDIMKLMEEPA